jgi:hypothetical protein
MGFLIPLLFATLECTNIESLEIIRKLDLNMRSLFILSHQQYFIKMGIAAAAINF